ncbi:MAG: isocitrate lyase/PEP mutase family protein [Myxococcales bacterium]|jgi:2-methylisocitrate lyase-like PEP mutase family enzyme
MSERLYGSAAGIAFRKRVATGKIVQFVGVYDVFSALVAAQRFDSVFLSGFGFAASQYGLPDIGYANWHDTQDYATRVRTVLPETHILVDIDDGYGEEPIVANTVKNLEACGVSAVQFEDQKRPRRCGHFQGKQILSADQYLLKLKAALGVRASLFVIARTDATDIKDGIRRAVRYAEAGADGVMVEAIHSLDSVAELVKAVGKPVMVNQLHGGKSPNWTVQQLEDAGVSIVMYSTPCLFAAQYGMERYLDSLEKDRVLSDRETVTMDDCTEILFQPLTHVNTN